MNIKMLGDYVMIKRINVYKTTGGLHLPNEWVDERPKGIVVAIGPGKFNRDGDFISTSVQINDIVVFHKFDGSIIGIDGQKYYILHEHEILVILENYEYEKNHDIQDDILNSTGLEVSMDGNCI
jgi:chaperonin GroES